MALNEEGLYPPGKAPAKKTGLPPLPDNGFKNASDIKPDEWDRQFSRRMDALVRLSDYALAHAKEMAPDDWGRSIDVEVEGFSVKITTAPPPRAGGGGGWNKPQATFNVAAVEAIAAEYPDKLKVSRDGGKIQLYSDKHPGDEIVAKFKAAGLKWNGTSRKWEQP